MKVSRVSACLALVCLLSLGFCSCTSDTSPPSLSDYPNPKSALGPAPVSATGQDTCYNSDGLLIDCASTGQDGELQKGVPRPNDRYTDNGDGTFTDTHTGLMWMKNDNCIDEIHSSFMPFATPDNMVSWELGLQFAAAVNAGTYHCDVVPSYTDWRVPNVREMESLSDFISRDREVEVLTNDLKLNYLTSTTVIDKLAGGPIPFTWMVSGDFFINFSRKTSFDYTVWLVRTDPGILSPFQVAATGQTSCYSVIMSPIACAGTGQDGELQKGVPLPTPRFTDNTNGTVTDNLTGLMWMKEANCLSNLLPGVDQDYTPGDGNVSWQHALDFISGLNYGAHNCGLSDVYSDWRLPNINELRSLNSFQTSYPAISNTIGDGGWSNGDPFNGIYIPFMIDLTLPGFTYWSSTSTFDPPVLGVPNPNPALLSVAEEVMTMEINYGRTFSKMKTETGGVWPVRGGN